MTRHLEQVMALILHPAICKDDAHLLIVKYIQQHNEQSPLQESGLGAGQQLPWDFMRAAVWRPGLTLLKLLLVQSRSSHAQVLYACIVTFQLLRSRLLQMMVNK